MTGGGFAPYIDAHHERRGQPGYTCLAIAENLQVFDLLRPKLEAFPPLDPNVAAYDDPAGRAPLREAIADLLGRELFGRDIDPDHVRVLAGASGVLDALGHALGDPGDAVLVPTPSYAGFWPDLQVRPGLRIVEVPTHAEEGYALTPDTLDRAMANSPGPVRALLLTNPDNPRGQVRPAEEVTPILDWAADRRIHLIADEIYGLSVFDGPAFPSVGRLRDDLGDLVHVVWGLSKDFGMSGLRTGVLITANDALRQAMDLQGMWGGVSGHTQHVATAMLGDREWVDGYLTTMRQRLSDAADRLSTTLETADIVHTRPTAGFFTLLDLRDRLTAPTWDDEHALWARLLDESGVNLTPGSALRAPEPGWFRLCYAANPPAVVDAAVTRVVEALRKAGL